MNRDMDLARRILHETEKAPFDGGWVKPNIPDVQDDALQYHLLLLWEAGLIDARDMSSHDGPCYAPIRLTWHGHEFLDASRNDTIWAKAKDIVLKQGGAMTFEVLHVVLKRLVLQAVHIPSI